MSEIDFYLISDTIPKARLSFACKLLEKAYTKQHQIYVHTPDAATANQLNDMLWTFHDISFVPHQIVDEKTQDTPPPIVIGFSNDNPAKHHDILMNLDTNIPIFFKEFDRIIEIVSEDENQKNISRNKYKQYKQNGYEIKINDLKNRY